MALLLRFSARNPRDDSMVLVPDFRFILKFYSKRGATSKHAIAAILSNPVVRLWDMCRCHPSVIHIPRP